MILLNDYEKIANYSFDAGNIWQPPSGIVKVITQDVPLFFKTCGNNGRKYIVISFNSDYGVEYQHENHPNLDLIKMLHYYKWNEISNKKDGYVALATGPACNIDNCNFNDKYSVKVYSFTHATFNEIPDNIIRWYSTNVNIDHEKVRGWPFGIHDGIKKVIDNYKDIPKTKICYFNIRNHTLERLGMTNYFRKCDWCTFIEDSIPLEEYLQHIAEHKFVICPPGVGVDCFRVYESIYLGSIPIIYNNYFSRTLHGLPALIDKDFLKITKEDLENVYEEMTKHDWLWGKLELDYWENVVRKDWEDNK